MGSASSTTNASEGMPELKAPEGNDSILQKAAAPLATFASHPDPWPHYIMSGAYKQQAELVLEDEVISCSYSSCYLGFIQSVHLMHPVISSTSACPQLFMPRSE